jgi:hypothetical protein
MPRPCSICVHVNREAIDTALVAGEPCRVLAVRFGMSPDAMERHKRGHLPATLTKAAAVAEVAHAGNLLDEVQRQRMRADELYHAAAKLLRKANREHDAGGAVAAIRAAVVALREGRGSLALIGDMLAALPQDGISESAFRELVREMWCVVVHYTLQAGLTPEERTIAIRKGWLMAVGFVFESQVPSGASRPYLVASQPTS